MTALKIAPETMRPKAELKTVTPRMAKDWLKRNVRNRAVRPSMVDAYARDMLAGRWQVTGEAIKFDTNDALSDGQHRLSAIVKSGVAVEMLIVRGVAPDAQTVMDSGAKRTASDALTLVGQKNPAVLAAAARFALREPGAGFMDDRERVPNPTNSEIAAFIEETPSIHHAADLAQHYYPSFDAPPSVLAVCWMRFAAIELEDAALFFSAVANNSTDGLGDPRSALIRRLANARRNNERLTQVAYLSMIFRAWNAWRAGKSLTSLPAESRHGDVKVPAKLL